MTNQNKKLVDNVPVMIWVLDADMQPIFFNNTWLEFTGRTQEEEKAEDWIEGVHPDDMAVVIESWNQHFDTRSGFKLEYRMKRWDGQYIWLHVMSQPAYDEVGVFTGFVSGALDVHDKKEEEQIKADAALKLRMQTNRIRTMDMQVKQRMLALQEANLNLERSNKELQQFALTASSDLQEPLRKIMTFADRLCRDAGDSLSVKGLQFINRIEESATQMRQLIEDILNFSRLGAELIHESVDLDHILTNVLKDQAKLIADVKARITTDRLPTIQAVPIQMEQLFNNVINNALKFASFERSPLIEIKVNKITKKVAETFSSLDPKNSHIEILVIDNGIGFEEKFAEEIFDLFQQLGTGPYQGTGLGLAFSKKIVAFHKGHIYAQAVPGHGTTIHIILPVNQPKLAYKELKK